MSFLNGIFSNPKFITLGFDIGDFFQNLNNKVQEWGTYFIMFLGAVLIIWGVVSIVKAFISHGRGQTNWLMTIGMILVGGFMLVSGFTGFQNLANIGNDTILEMGTSGGGGG